jgi:RimJ/RimL family protein N-acetyltransferase
VSKIDAQRLVLRPVAREVAAALLNGRSPNDVLLGPGYPSQFSLEVMEMVAGAPEHQVGPFGPFFIVRKDDGAVLGEIGGFLDTASGTVQVGYSVVEPCWGHGIATEALRALLGHVLADPSVTRVMAETLVDHTASRRVMEKAGLRYCGERVGEVDGQTEQLVVYEVLADGT